MEMDRRGPLGGGDTIRTEPQIGYHFRKEAREGRKSTVYQRLKWLKKYRAYKKWLLWKTTRNK